MKKIFVSLFVIIGLMFVASCNNYETYAEQKDKERNAISQMIADSAINVISETEFAQKGYTTDVSKNEYVLFESTGVYMQIIRKGCGSVIKDGETCTVLCRFTEKNIMTDSLLCYNIRSSQELMVDKMSVTRSSNTFTASFVSGVMLTVYSSVSVPSGWLVPLLYINVGRPENETEEIARVKLIVPHSQGTASATTSVYPCLYNITYQKGL